MSIFAIRRGDMPKATPIRVDPRHMQVLAAIAVGALSEDDTYESWHAVTGERMTYEANDLHALGLVDRGSWGDGNLRPWAITPAGRERLAWPVGQVDAS